MTQSARGVCLRQVGAGVQKIADRGGEILRLLHVRQVRRLQHHQSRIRDGIAQASECAKGVAGSSAPQMTKVGAAIPRMSSS